MPCQQYQVNKCQARRHTLLSILISFVSLLNQDVTSEEKFQIFREVKENLVQSIYGWRGIWPEDESRTSTS